MRFAALLLSASLVLQTTSAFAALIVVSGDTNPANRLNGPVDPGNQQFFQNVLGSGSTVLIQQDGFGQAAPIDTYYNSLIGVSSSILASGATITPGDLAGVDLFVGILPTDGYTAAETNAIDNFVNGGGTLFLLGDRGPATPTENARLNALLSALGSSLSIQNDDIDLGFNQASFIAPDALTAGVNTFEFAASSQVLGGVPIIFGTQMRPIIAYESVAAVVPEPGSLAIWSALAGVALFARRRRRTA